MITTLSITSYYDVLGSVNPTTGEWTAADDQTWVTLTQSAGDSTTYTVKWEADNSEDAAKAFAKWLHDNKGSITADKNMTSNGTTASVSTDVEDGYWLIESSLGTALVLATSDIEITTKNQYVTDDKTAPETNYNVGDMVPYTITVNLPATIDYTKPVIVHDTMDSVLALQDSTVSAKVGEAAFNGITLVKSDSFASNHHADHAAADGKTLFDFVLDISSLAPAAGTEPEAKTITITYQAELTSAAATDTGYVNKEFTEYSKYKTVPNDVTVKTYDIEINKIFTGASSDSSLEATFQLYGSTTTPGARTYYTDPEKTTPSTDNAETEYYTEAAGTASKGSEISLIEENKYENYVRPDSDDTATTTTTITVKQGTTAQVRGLKAGTYYLTETTTADGYNKLTEDIVVVIDADGNVTYTIGSDSGSDQVDVVNNSGTVLPSTGGIGTTIFYVVGSIMVVAAGVLLVTKKRMSREG